MVQDAPLEATPRCGIEQDGQLRLFVIAGIADQASPPCVRRGDYDRSSGYDDCRLGREQYPISPLPTISPLPLRPRARIRTGTILSPPVRPSHRESEAFVGCEPTIGVVEGR